MAVSPFEYHDPFDVIQNGYIDGNSGNQVYQYSVLRSLLREDTEIDFIRDRNIRQGDYVASEINEKYDAVVLPFANAFRDDYCDTLTAYTKLIKKLTIPCIVVGIGIQERLRAGERSKEHIYDEPAKDFLRAVMEHSSMMGVRGEVTADYIKSLGFSQYEIIGCPSMYMFGENLPVPEKKPLTEQSVLGITGSVGNPPKVKSYLMKLRQQFPDYYYIPQLMPDLKLIYLGTSITETEGKKVNFPSTIDHPDFIKGKARFFINMPSMLEFMPRLDFNFGTRFHGGVPPMLCGVPSLFLPTDARVLELVQYHNLPYIPYDSFEGSMDMFELYEKIDFAQVLKGHKERFAKYVGFLETNGLQHIYDDLYRKQHHGEARLDREMKDVPYYPPVESITTAGPGEVAERLLKWQQLQADPSKDKISAGKTNDEILKWYRSSSALKIGASRVYSRLRGGAEVSTLKAA